MSPHTEPGADGPAERSHDDVPDSGCGSAICPVCPICQGFEGLRHARPELAEHLAAAAAALAAAVREMLNAHPSTAEAPRPHDDPGQPGSPPHRGVPVERIEVTD
jgi:hypothetical protein